VQLERRQPVAREAEVQQILHRGAQRRELRRPDARRQQRAPAAEALADDLPLQVGVAAATEDHLNRRQTLARGRANRLDVLRAAEHILERSGHERLHLRGIQARRLHLHEYVRRREVGEHVESGAEQRARTEQRDEQRQGRHDPWSGQRAADDRGEHGR